MKYWLDKQKMSAQILYSLLTLAIASDHLVLDKYAIFYVCKIARSNRTTAVRLLERQVALKYLSKKTCTIDPTLEKEIKESTTCPPLVKREYTTRERVTNKYDLAVVYKDGNSEIPRKWVWRKYIEGRALQRDAYRFTRNWTMPIVQAANVLSHLSKERDLLVDWARKPREETEARLRDILQCYGFDRSYQMISEDSCRSSIFAGLALYDFEYSQVSPFEMKNVDLSKFLTKL